MATETVEQELVQLERQYWQAIKDKDIDAIMRLTDNPCGLFDLGAPQRALGVCRAH